MRRAFQINGRLFLAVVLTAGVSFAAERQPLVAVTGDIPHPARYSLDQLEKLPVIKIKVRDHDSTEAEYSGVQVEELLRRAGVPMGKELRGRALLTKGVLVHAADGYQVLFSLAELDPAMASQPALLVWSRNGQPLLAAQGPLRLVVPNDKRQARWVRQVTAIEVISVNRPAITNVASTLPAHNP